MSADQFTVAELEAQKQEVKQYYEQGDKRIDAAGYYNWVIEQDKLIAQAKFREAATGTSPPSTPLPAPPKSNNLASMVTNPDYISYGGNIPKVDKTPHVEVNTLANSARGGTAPSFSGGAVVTDNGRVIPKSIVQQTRDLGVVVTEVGQPKSNPVDAVVEFYFGPEGTPNTMRDPNTIKVNTLANSARGGTAPSFSGGAIVTDNGRVLPTSIIHETRDRGVSIAEVGQPLETKYLFRQGLFALSVPVFMLFPAAAVVGVGLGVGSAQAMKTGSQLFKGEDLTLLTGEEAFYAGTVSAIFSGFNAGVTGALVEAGKSTVVLVGSRVITNTVLGGTTSGIVETAATGETSLKTVGKGAAIAFALSLGIEGAMAAKPYLPFYKHGTKYSPYIDPKKGVFDIVNNQAIPAASEQGYIAQTGIFRFPAAKSLRGGVSDALPRPVKYFTSSIKVITGETPPSAWRVITGKNVSISENALIPYNIGATKGFQPTTSLQTLGTLDAMKLLGYGPAEIALIGDLRGLAAPVQNVKVNPETQTLPAETSTLNTAGMTAFKKLVAENSKNIRLFGSNVLQPQLTSDVSYRLTDTYRGRGNKTEISNRLPMDIDVQFTGSSAEADKFVADILQIGKETNNPLHVEPDKPYQIIGVNRETGLPAHAFDIKVSGAEETATENTTGLLWGFEQSKPATKIENLPVQRLDEQINRLSFDSVLNFNKDRTLSPVAHRKAKDTIRTLHALETAYKIKGVDITNDPRFVRVMEYFGVTRETLRKAQTFEYTLGDTTTPTTTKPNGTQNNDLPIDVSQNSFNKSSSADSNGAFSDKTGDTTYTYGDLVMRSRHLSVLITASNDLHSNGNSRKFTTNEAGVDSSVYSFDDLRRHSPISNFLSKNSPRTQSSPNESDSKSSSSNNKTSNPIFDLITSPRQSPLMPPSNKSPYPYSPLPSPASVFDTPYTPSPSMPSPPNYPSPPSPSPPPYLYDFPYPKTPNTFLPDNIFGVDNSPRARNNKTPNILDLYGRQSRKAPIATIKQVLNRNIKGIL